METFNIGQRVIVKSPNLGGREPHGVVRRRRGPAELLADAKAHLAAATQDHARYTELASADRAHANVVKQMADRLEAAKRDYATVASRSSAPGIYEVQTDHDGTFWVEARELHNEEAAP